MYYLEDLFLMRIKGQESEKKLYAVNLYTTLQLFFKSK